MSQKFNQGYTDARGSVLEKPGVGVMFAAGTAVPADGTAGFATGCQFLLTNGNASTCQYRNEGTSTASAFRTSTGGGVPLTVTAATQTIDSSYASKRIVLNRAAGITVTLPAATGTGNAYTFYVGATVTSNNHVIKVANSTDIMQGFSQIVSDDGAGGPCKGFIPGAADDTITLNGTTTGGYVGDVITVVDIAAGLFAVRVEGKATGTEATPFSSTV